MASGASVSTAAYITKRVYLKGDLPSELTKRKHPLWGMLKRKSNYFGADAFYALKHSNPQSISGSFATTLTQSETSASSPQGMQLQMTPALRFGRITVDGVSMLKTNNNTAAFTRLWRHASEGVFSEFGKRFGFNIYRDGTGARGQRASEATDVTTLTAAGTARNFEIGMTVRASPNADGSSPRVGSTPITSVNLNANTIGLDTSALTAYADTDYLFAEDEIGSGTNIDGLEVHFPLATPTGGESFRGSNDRSVYPERLAGSRVDNVNAPPEENLGLVGVNIAAEGGTANCAFVNPVTCWAIARRMGAKVEFADFGGTVKYGYQYVMIHTPGGVLKVISDPDCPLDRGFVCDDSDLFLAHADPVVHVIKDDGRLVLRQPADDGLEQRWRSLSQTYVLVPKNHGVCSI